MEFIKIKFSDGFEGLDARCQNSFDDIFQSLSPLFTLSQRSWNPQMDIFETPDEIVIHAELAGVEKEDLGVDVSSKAVRVYGCRRELAQNPGANYRLAEIQYGKFERILFLPTRIDAREVASSFRNGLLQLRLKKIPLGKAYKIPILDE